MRECHPSDYFFLACMALLGVLFQMRLGVHWKSFGTVEDTRRSLRRRPTFGRGDFIPFLALILLASIQTYPLQNTMLNITSHAVISSFQMLDVSNCLQTVNLYASLHISNFGISEE